MLTITVGSPAMQDVSWGGPKSLPVTREDRFPGGGVTETAATSRVPVSLPQDAASRFTLVSVRLLGVIEITRARER